MDIANKSHFHLRVRSAWCEALGSEIWSLLLRPSSCLSLTPWRWSYARWVRVFQTQERVRCALGWRLDHVDPEQERSHCLKVVRNSPPSLCIVPDIEQWRPAMDPCWAWVAPPLVVLGVVFVGEYCARAVVERGHRHYRAEATNVQMIRRSMHRNVRSIAPMTLDRTT